MKRIIAIILTALLLAFALPALAEGASLPGDAEDFIPQEVRQFFSSSAFNGYAVHPGASMYFENTAGGTFFFTVAQKDGYNVLYGFEEKNGRFNYWLKTDSAIPQGRGFFALGNHSGDWYLLTADPIHLGPDNLSILFTREDDEEQAEACLAFEVNKNGQWLLRVANFHSCWDEAVVSENGIQYYLNEGSVREFVPGVQERNLRYFSWDAFPKNVKDAKAALSNPPAIPTGELTAQRIKFEGGQKFPVYSGPGPQYERLGDGRAIVSTNDWIQVFGSENGYILIQYDITSDHMRFGWIEQSALPRSAAVSPLRFAYDDAAITAACALTDDPLFSRVSVRSLFAGEGVKWLAAMGEWVYVETADRGAPVRGFVARQSVRRPDEQTVFSGAYRCDEYEAQALVTVTKMALGGQTLDVTVRVTASAAWAQAGADAITGYRLYANQTLLAEWNGGTQNDGAWDYTFSTHVSLPDNTAVLGLCPVRAQSGLKAEEMMTVSLRNAEK